MSAMPAPSDAIAVLREVLRQRARQAAQEPALLGDTRCLDNARLEAGVLRLAAMLRDSGAQTIALHADNGPAWVVADLAIAIAGLRGVPLPRFFSATQIQHALRDSGADALLADDDTLAVWLGSASLPIDVAGEPWRWQRLATNAVALPPQTQKITYTSGTTGDPKGVCLSLDSQLRVARSLQQASGSSPADRHLCVLPLATLLENLGGVYAALLAGAVLVVPSQAAVGLGGATQFAPQALLSAIAQKQATTAILVPQLLQGLLMLDAPRVPTSLRFVAVGGAPLAPALLQRAQARGWPLYEGYGLSECSSVLALNTADAQRAGSVGRALPHVQLRIAADGEVLARGAGFLGYVGDAARDPQDWVATGDLGRLDADGFLFLEGRKKSQFITAFGRNVAPEWVERELTQHPAIAQAAVFGEARPYNVAVITPRAPAGADRDAAIDAAIRSANAALPDYARVQRWICSFEPFSLANGQLTSNGRVRRVQVAAHYAAELESLYPEIAA